MRKRYWLRGVTVLWFLYAIVTVALIPLGSTGACEVICISYFILPSLPVVIILSPIRMLNGYPHTLGYSIMFIAGTIFYSALGALMGWIYGKIKDRKATI